MEKRAWVTFLMHFIMAFIGEINFFSISYTHLPGVMSSPLLEEVTPLDECMVCATGFPYIILETPFSSSLISLFLETHLIEWEYGVEKRSRGVWIYPLKTWPILKWKIRFFWCESLIAKKKTLCLNWKLITDTVTQLTTISYWLEIISKELQATMNCHFAN